MKDIVSIYKNKKENYLNHTCFTTLSFPCWHFLKVSTLKNSSTPKKIYRENHDFFPQEWAVKSLFCGYLKPLELFDDPFSASF